MTVRAVIAAVLFAWASAAHAAPVELPNVRVVDGDTVAVGETVYRLVGFDAPETGKRARCPAEMELGTRAASRLETIVAQGKVSLEQVACACRAGTEGTPFCNYGRRCAILRMNGRDVAERMIAEGLARAYICGAARCAPRESWCP
jgi:endonuclease YncB( thermonuclease family)